MAERLEDQLNIQMEDIIKRGGGNLVMELFGSDRQGNFYNKPINVKTDSVLRTVPSGRSVILTPGESICLELGIFHRFMGEKEKVRFWWVK